MTRLVFSPSAQRDIDSIFDYSAEYWGAPQAVRYVEDLRDICLSLANGTRRGQAVDYVRQGYSRIKAGSHFIFYRQSPTKTEIVRILHQRMNVESHL